jgi:hypothetical protein
VRERILYVPEGVVLDLAEPDLGHPDGYEILWHHYRQSARKSMGFSKDNPAFICLAHQGGTNPGLFLKRIGEQWWACHYVRSDACTNHRIPAPMSDEHKRQREYWARAAENAGWRVDLEYALPSGPRPDAVIHGTVLAGVEVRRSAMTATAAIARTKKAAAAGVSDVWFAGSDIHMTAGKISPPWAYRVPSVGALDLGWDVLPPRGSATATGLRLIRAKQCTRRNFPNCPDTGRRVCGGWHGIPEPLDRSVDEVAAQFPAGELVPLRVRRKARSGHTFVVRAQDAELYEELTGGKPQETAATPPGISLPASAVECTNDQPAMMTLDSPLQEPQVQHNPGTPHRKARQRKSAQPTTSDSSEACPNCGYPAPDGNCARQACKVVRLYHAQQGQ